MAKMVRHRYLFIGILSLLVISIVQHIAYAKEVTKRSCFGLLWCTEERDGEKSTDALFYLYSREEKGDITRLSIRPFYSYESDPARGYLRRSILLSLRYYEKNGEDIHSHLLPFYWYGKEPDRHYKVILPSYIDYTKGDRSYFHIFPIYGHHTRGKLYDRYFILGPLYISTSDKSKDLEQLDIIYPFIKHWKEGDKGGTRFILYFSEYNHSNGYSSRYLFPFYGNLDTPTLHQGFLFPLYGFIDRKTEGEKRFSLLGLPPLASLKSIPTLALYEHLTAPGHVSDRFFPLYRYERWWNKSENEVDTQRVKFYLLGYNRFSLLWYRTDIKNREHHLFPVYSYYENLVKNDLRWNILILFNYQSTPHITANSIFPLYDYQESIGRKDWRLDILGISPVSLYHHRYTPSLTIDRLFPVYGYRRSDSGRMAFSAIGLPPSEDGYTMALYEHRKDTLLTSDRFFPLYSYLHNHKREEIKWDILLLYNHQSMPDYTKDTFLPLHYYENDRARQIWRFDMLVVPPLTMFHYQVSPLKTTNYLFPLYSYNRDSGTKQFGLVGYRDISLYSYRDAPTSLSHYLFPVYGYKNSHGDETRFSLIGLPLIGDTPAISIYEHRTSPYILTDRLSPLYWYYRNNHTDETYLNLFILGNIYKNTSTGEKKVMVFPFFNHEIEGDSLKELSIIGYHEFSIFHYINTRYSLSHSIFPIYSYRYNRIEERISLNAILLYRHSSTPDTISDTFFPLFHFKRNKSHTSASKEWHLSAIGLEPFLHLSLFNHIEKNNSFKGSLFPLYSYSHDKIRERGDIGIAGIKSFSLYYHHYTPDESSHRIFPVFSYYYNLNKEETHINILDISWEHGLSSILSVYRYNGSPKRRTHRLFSLYNYSLYKYSHDYERDERVISAAILFRYKDSPVERKSHLFPLYSYEKDKTDNNQIIGVVGFAPFSLFEYSRRGNDRYNRFFPLYRYSYSDTTKEGRFSFLWPLVDYKSLNGKMTDMSIIWEVVRYEKNNTGEKRFRILGRFLRRETTPEYYMFEFNPIIPLYRFREEKGKWSEHEIFGGLVSIRKEGKKTKTDLFWGYGSR